MPLFAIAVLLIIALLVGYAVGSFGKGKIHDKLDAIARKIGVEPFDM